LPTPRLPRTPHLSALTRRRFIGLSAAGAAGLALGACGDDDDDTAASGTTSGSDATSATDTTRRASSPTFDGRTITTAVYAKNHASSPLYWQQFAPEGLTVEPVIFTSPSDINRALESGELDFGLMGPYNSLVEAEQGFGAKIICMCSRQGIGVVGRSDQGIETAADLAGKRVAIPPPGVQVLVLTYLLAQEGLVIDRDLQGIPLGFADHPGALERGDVDAFAGTEPLVTQSVAPGIGTRLSGVYDTPLGDLNTAMWAAPKNQEDADLLTAVVQMQRDAAEFLTPGGENDREVWQDLLVTQFGYSEEVYEEVLDNIGAVWEFGDDRREQFEGVAELLLGDGLLTREPDFDSLFLLDFLPES